MSERGGPGSGDTPLHAALLQYAQAPGKYQLTLRQPAILFQSIREILQVAAGRAGGEQQAPVPEDLREAAGFFLRAALLYPGADHYAVLGLPPRSEPVELKERYRLLMRLIHPDYAAAGVVPWPADAAVRVNRAYEVLSSPLQRREYDAQLAAVAAKAPVEAAPRRPHGNARHGGASGRTWTLNRTAAATVLGGSAVLLALVLLMPAPAPQHLVQRAPAPMPAAAARTDTEPAGPQVQAPPAPLPVAQQEAPAPVPTPLAGPAPAPAAGGPAWTVAAAPPVPASRAPVLPVPPARPEAPQSTPARAPAASVAMQSAPGAPAATRHAAPPVAAVPAPAALPVPPPAAAVQPMKITPAAVVASQAPTLADAQPLLTQLLQLLESGSSEQLLWLLEAEGRADPSAQALSRHYEQLVRGGRPVRLSHVEFRGEQRDSSLLVTGRIRLHAGEPTIGSHGERIVVRAEFASRGGRVMLTNLSGGGD